MSVSEQDLELLESYLDDELSPEESESLRGRLSSEPALVSTMEELRTHRDLRQRIFAAAEPQASEVEQLIRSVRKNMTRQLVWSQRLRIGKLVGSLAACLMVGLMGGYALHGGSQGSTGSSPSLDLTSASADDKPDRALVFDGPTQHAANSGPSFSTPFATNPNELAGYQVNLLDETGNVVGVQRFHSADQARQFMTDASAWQNQHRPVAGGDKQY